MAAATHPPAQPPADDPRAALMAAHGRLLAGSRTASDPLFRLLAGQIVRYLARFFPHADEHLLQDAMVDAVWDHCERPARYDPTRGIPLDGYLQMAAWRNAFNLVRGERRRKAAERRAVEGSESIRLVADDPLAGNIFQEEVDQYLAVLADERDRQFMRLMIADETNPRRLADALDLPAGLPPDELRAAVKRATDRIRKTLARKGPKT